MRISITEIKDYLKCPLYYKFKNIDELPVDKNINEYFKDYFKLALYYYYFSVMENKKKSFEGMMKRWGELWFSGTMTDLFSEDELKSKSNEAVVLMTDFFKRMASEPCIPIAVNFQYEAIFEGKENLHVVGDIDIIKVINDRTARRETQIGIFSLNKRYPDIFIIKNDIIISVASYAFRSNFKSKEDKIVINNVACDADTPTIRTGGDFSRAEKSIRNICRAIQGGIYYPNANQISCSTCPYKIFCLSDKSINTGGEINALRD